MRIKAFGTRGVIVEGRRGTTLGLAYGEILTAERLTSGRGLRLHTRTEAKPVKVRCRGSHRVEVEAELRKHGVRIVDEYGAMITPTLDDFEAELARDPFLMRQSSDDA